MYIESGWHVHTCTIVHCMYIMLYMLKKEVRCIHHVYCVCTLYLDALIFISAVIIATFYRKKRKCV